MKRLRTPDFVVGLGGLIIIVSLFAPWTQLSDGTEDGWRSLVIVDILLLLIAIAALFVPVITATSDSPSPAIKADVLTAWAMLLGVILTLIKVVGGPEWGGFLAFAGTLVGFAGCWWAMRLESAPGLRTPPEVQAMPVPPANDPTRPAT